MKHKKFLVASVVSLWLGLMVIFLGHDIVPALPDGALVPFSVITTLAIAFGAAGLLILGGDKTLSAQAAWRKSHRVKKSRRIFRVI